MLRSPIIVVYLLFSGLDITTQIADPVKNKHQENQRKWFEDRNGLLKWSHGCSLQNGGFFAVDVDKIQITQSSTCPNLCYEDSRCTHFVHTNGFCNLKMFKFVEASPKAAIYNNPGGLCGFVVKRPDVKKNWLVGDNGKTRWSTECDFPSAKSNIYTAFNFIMFDRSKCSAYCLSVKRCTHFAWIMPGTCFVKDFRGAPIVQTVDATVPICGFIPERQDVVQQKTEFKTNVSSQTKSSISKFSTTTHSPSTWHQKVNGYSSPQPKKG